MKKFFSLVLALVMALSLTTVAWGADVPVTDSTELKNAVLTSQPGDVIKPAAGTYSLDVGAIAGQEVVIDGSAGAVFTYIGLSGNQGSVTIKNCTIKVGSVWCGICIEGKGNYTIDNCDFVLADSVTDAGSAIYMTAQYADNTYTIKNCSFDGTYNEAAVVVQEQNVTGEYDVTISGNDFSAVDTDAVGVWGKDDSLQMTSDAEEVLLAREADLANTVNIAEAGDTIKLMSNATVTGLQISKPLNFDANGYTLTGLTAGSGVTTDTSGKLTSGTFAAAPAAADVADGYAVLQNTDGTYVVVPAATFGDKYDLYLANVGMQTALKNKTPAVPGLSFEAVDAKKNLDGSGRVAYIAANNGQFFVKTTNPTVADYAVTYAGKTDVLYYVTVAGTDAANFYYDEEVKAFNNWGLKCGQINNTGWSTALKAEDYFMASDYVVYMAAPAGVGVNYLLDGVVVSGIAVGPTIDHHFVASNFKYDAATGANVPTAALCTTCTQTTTAIYKIGKAPANAVVKPLYVDGRVSDVWEVVPVATSAGGAVSVPSTDKTVTSAETFDAGIAMYVGMSVMAAAGSAVVIGKKKD